MNWETNRAKQKYGDPLPGFVKKVYIIYSLSGFSGNMRKEVTKSANGILWQRDPECLTGNFKPKLCVQIWEHCGETMISERIKNSLNQNGLEKFYFWRTYDQQEIDLIETHRDGSLRAYEFKWGRAPGYLKVLVTSYPKVSFQVVNPTELPTSYL